MSQGSPRVPPLSPDKFTDEQSALAGEWRDLNFTRVLVQHPSLYRVMMPFGEKLMRGSSLPPRDREILIIRTLALCEETYEAHHHAMIGTKVGLTDVEVQAIQTGTGLSPSGLSPFEQTLVRMAEELVRRHCVSDEVWRHVTERYSVAQMIEAMFLVGNYAMTSMITRSCGMQVEGEPSG